MSIGQLTGWDSNQIAEAAHDSVKMFITHHNEIFRIAETLCNGSIYQAWADIIEKGILELEKICEMDDDVKEGKL